MAQFLALPPPPARPNPVSIIGPQYCAADRVYLTIVRKVINITKGNFYVKDINGKILFYLKGFLMTLHNHRVLYDADGTPLVTLRKKIRSAHDRWRVFRGESTDLTDLIFTAKKSSMFQFNKNLDVFLAENIEERDCDFRVEVEGSRSNESCDVYSGESGTVVARMNNDTSTFQRLIGKDRFEVSVYANIDHAFIITLIMILDAVDPLPLGVDATKKFLTQMAQSIGLGF